MKDAKDFCTCTDTRCPCHPINRDQGCSRCIQKNLREKEIPSCFFHDIACEKPTDAWHYANISSMTTPKGIERIWNYP